LEAAAKAAQAISSDLVLSEVYMLYEHMLAMWGQEPRVRALARLFQERIEQDYPLFSPDVKAPE
jgi:hypothetical protein